MAIASIFFWTPRAQAFENPIGTIINLSKDTILKTKNISIDNQPAADENSANALVQAIKPEKKSPKDSFDLQEIENAAEFASQMTGVRKDFLMGMLTVESNLGRNVGKCTYKEVEDGANQAYSNGKLSKKAWENFQRRQKIIEEISNKLGYNPDELKVSCNPSEAVYYGTGGAMGLSQFMPDTWLEYRDRTAAIVGKVEPDPWDATDAVVAMALKVSDVYGVTQHNRLAEKNAAKLYLSGTTSWKYNWYANEIQYWSDNYDKIMG